MEETRKYASVCYNVSKYSSDIVNAYEVEDLQVRARVQAVADRASQYLKIPKMGVYITPSHRVSSFGSYSYRPIRIKSKHSKECLLLPQEAADFLDDNELLAYILSEKSGKRYIKVIQSAWNISIFFMFFAVVYCFTLSVILGIAVLLIWLGILAFIDEFLEKKDIIIKDKTAIRYTGNKESLMKALVKLFEEKLPGADTSKISAPLVWQRIEIIEKTKYNTDSFIRR